MPQIRMIRECFLPFLLIVAERRLSSLSGLWSGLLLSNVCLRSSHCHFSLFLHVEKGLLKVCKRVFLGSASPGAAPKRFLRDAKIKTFGKRQKAKVKTVLRECGMETKPKRTA